MYNLKVQEKCLWASYMDPNLIYQARESSPVPTEFLTVNLLHKLQFNKPFFCHSGNYAYASPHYLSGGKCGQAIPFKIFYAFPFIQTIKQVSPTVVHPSQRFHILNFLQKLRRQKPCQGQARLSSLVNILFSWILQSLKYSNLPITCFVLPLII